MTRNQQGDSTFSCVHWLFQHERHRDQGCGPGRNPSHVPEWGISTYKTLYLLKKHKSAWRDLWFFFFFFPKTKFCVLLKGIVSNWTWTSPSSGSSLILVPPLPLLLLNKPRGAGEIERGNIKNHSLNKQALVMLLWSLSLFEPFPLRSSYTMQTAVTCCSHFNSRTDCSCGYLVDNLYS